MELYSGLAIPISQLFAILQPPLWLHAVAYNTEKIKKQKGGMYHLYRDSREI